jgi:Winged helix DNA-binding domain
VTRPAGGAAPVLTRRALNRTTLWRQALLERAAMAALDMVGQLVAVQAQEPDAPYVGLWTRLEGFDHAELARLLEARRVVRSSVLRGTQHLVTADDYLWLRPLVQPLLERTQRGGPRAAEPRRGPRRAGLGHPCPARRAHPHPVAAPRPAGRAVARP